MEERGQKQVGQREKMSQDTVTHIQPQLRQHHGTSEVKVNQWSFPDIQTFYTPALISHFHQLRGKGHGL